MSPTVHTYSSEQKKVNVSYSYIRLQLRCYNGSFTHFYESLLRTYYDPSTPLLYSIVPIVSYARRCACWHVRTYITIVAI